MTIESGLQSPLDKRANAGEGQNHEVFYPRGTMRSILSQPGIAGHARVESLYVLRLHP